MKKINLLKRIEKSSKASALILIPAEGYAPNPDRFSGDMKQIATDLGIQGDLVHAYVIYDGERTTQRILELSNEQSAAIMQIKINTDELIPYTAQLPDKPVGLAALLG